jgi:diguanylate cyclase (GGDEF)-like protein/PAS domain S-box-containing protein
MIKKVDTLTVLLTLFVIFISTLFAYLIKIDYDIQKYEKYHESIDRLSLKSKVFDSFLLNRSTFINYDKINKDTKNFEDTIDYLRSIYKKENFTKEYIEIINELENLYKNKMENIEYFKSQNSQLLDSLHYMHDLKHTLWRDQNINDYLKILVADVYIHLLQLYISPIYEKQQILYNINLIKANMKNIDNHVLNIYLSHTMINIKRIEGFRNIQKTLKNNKIDIALQDLQSYLNESYSEEIFKEKSVLVIFFVLAFLILIILIFISRRSAKIKDELYGFKTAIENSYNSVVMTDPDSNIVYVNDIAQKETGYTKKELLGQNPRVLKSGLNEENFYVEMHEKLDNGEKWEGEFINKRKDGSLYHEKASIMPIFIDGKLVNYLAIKLNITDYIEATRKVKHMAYHDSLTSLPNRANIENYLETRLKTAQRQDTKIALLFIDLDRFKNINDTLGHDVGDELLIEVSKRISQALRKSDMLARFGGDEFVVILDGIDENFSATYVCEKILELFKKPIKADVHHLNITLSIGIALFPDDAQDTATLFKYADIAMYKAKNAGKNTYRFYKKELSVDADNRFEMEQALKTAMGNNEFYMMYQPQYRLSDKAIIGIEALVRWESETLGFVGPDKFIPVCEDIGYILELGTYIFRQSCIDFLKFQEISKSLKTVSINISAVQLYQNEFIDNITNIVNEVGIKTSSIIIEITETHVMKNVIHSMSVLNKLQSLGFNISIDDFGTGHSSLNYLKKFPISELKIDKSFVDSLPDDKDDISIVKAILALSKSMEYTNVAEGIENIKQEDFLLKNGCSIGQGYYFSKPLKKDDLEKFIYSHNSYSHS